MTKAKKKQEVEVKNIEVEAVGGIELETNKVNETSDYVEIKVENCNEECCEDASHDHSEEELGSITSINPEVSINSIFNDILNIPQIDIIELKEKPTISESNQIFSRPIKLITELSETLIEYADQLNPSFETSYSSNLIFHNVPKLCLYNILQGASEILRGYKLLSIIDNVIIDSLLEEIEYIDDYLVLDEDNYQLLNTVTSDVMLVLAGHFNTVVLKPSNIAFLTKDLTTIMTINNLCITIDDYLEYLSCACFIIDKSTDLSIMNMINDQEFNDVNELCMDQMMSEERLIGSLSVLISDIQLNLVKEYVNIINKRIEADSFGEDYDNIFNPPFKTSITDKLELFIQYFPEVNEYHVIISQI